MHMEHRKGRTTLFGAPIHQEPQQTLGRLVSDTQVYTWY